MTRLLLALLASRNLLYNFGAACKLKLAPQLYTTSLLVFTLSIAVLTASAELHQNTLMVDATNRENWAYINLTTGEVESVPTSVDAQRKLTTTWAAIKSY